MKYASQFISVPFDNCLWLLS